MNVDGEVSMERVNLIISELFDSKDFSSEGVDGLTILSHMSIKLADQKYLEKLVGALEKDVEDLFKDIADQHLKIHSMGMKLNKGESDSLYAAIEEDAKSKIQRALNFESTTVRISEQLVDSIIGLFEENKAPKELTTRVTDTRQLLGQMSKLIVTMLGDLDRVGKDSFYH
jgi:hypothetical protein